MTNSDSKIKSHGSAGDNLFSLYPELSQIEKNCWFKLINHSLEINLPPQTTMQSTSGPYDHFLLILKGQVRVYQIDDNGREVTFFRNYPGDICPDNLSCLINSEKTKNHIKAETAIHGIQISASAFHTAMQESDVFRNFIFSRLTKKFAGVTQTLQEAVFNKLDARLCHLLKDFFIQSEANTLKITHQRLANELGTTREVISRSLKTLEQKGCLKITRGQLTMIDPEKLRDNNLNL